MGELLDTLQHQYDIVIIDGAPLLPVTDSVVLARRCAGVVVVVGTGQVRRKELQRSLSDLETVGAPVVGVLLTKVPTRGPDGAGMKSYGYKSSTKPLNLAPHGTSAPPRVERAQGGQAGGREGARVQA